MARLFDDGSSQNLLSSATPVTAPPFAFACWFNSDILTGGQVLVCVADASAGGDWHLLRLGGYAAGDPVQVQTTAGGSGVLAETTTAYSANTWQHACGLFIATNSRAVLVDGANKGTNADDKTPSGIDRIGVGSLADNTPSQYMSGAIAEAGIWDLSVWPGATAADKADEFERLAVPALAKGYAPSFFPLGLEAYWRLIRDEDQDLVGGYDLTAYNAPSIAAHPPQMKYPAPPRIAYVTAAAPPATIVPIAMHHYRSMRL